MLNAAQNAVDFLTGNRLLNTALIACLIAQIIKVFLTLLMDHKWDWHRLVETGGMPSSHAALVVSLTTALGRIYGVQTPEFAVAACFSLIVMFDASGVRRQAGEHARIINLMIKNWDPAQPELFEENLRELLGHTPLQVMLGALLGLLVGLARL